MQSILALALAAVGLLVGAGSLLAEEDAPKPDGAAPRGSARPHDAPLPRADAKDGEDHRPGGDARPDGPRPMGPPPLRVLEQLGLSDEQKTKVREIVDAAHKAAEGKDPRERGEVIGKAWEEIVKTVLTDEQRTKMEQIRRQPPHAGPRPGPGAGPFAALDLTPEQREKIRAIMDAAHRKVIEEVLTPEQRKKMEQRRVDGPREFKRAPEGAGSADRPRDGADRRGGKDQD
jgi:Spy/CpxP family protein refolding chaperone